jgi:hypothetical protein
MIEESRAAMEDRYPSLEFRLEEQNGKPLGIWEGWLQPIRSRAGLNGIVCDLDADRQILIDRETASLAHPPKCTADHENHGLFDRLKRPDRAFRVRIEYTGGRPHPRAWLLDPVVTPKTDRHMFMGGRICAYPPQTNAWQWEENTVADFTDHVLVWTVKWNVWVETGYWLGGEENHDPLHLVATINSEMQCWCGSGITYGECCRPKDRQIADLEMEAMLRKHSPLLQFPSIDHPISFLNPTRRSRTARSVEGENSEGVAVGGSNRRN